MAHNSSSPFDISGYPPTLHVILNLISLLATFIGTSISFMMLFGVILRKKITRDTNLVLCANNYLAVFLLGVLELIHTVNVLRGDFRLRANESETMACRILAYIEFSSIFAVYLSCILQAVFRLCRILYSRYRWLVAPFTYFIVVPLLWMISFLSISPLFIWHGHRFIPGEYICRIRKNDSRSIAYATLVVHGLPFICLTVLYFRVHRFLRRHAASMTRLSRAKSRHRTRDILVFRRIIIVVVLLGSYGIPNSVMLLMLAITGELVVVFYRVLELSFAAAVLTLSLALIYVNPQLRRTMRLCGRETSVVSRDDQELRRKSHTGTSDERKATSQSL